MVPLPPLIAKSTASAALATLSTTAPGTAPTEPLDYNIALRVLEGGRGKVVSIVSLVRVYSGYSWGIVSIGPP